MYIKEISYRDEKYLKLINSAGTVFNLPEWLCMFEKNIITIGIFNDNHELIGSFFLYKGTKWGMKYIITPPYTPNIGLIYKNPAQSRANGQAFDKEIINLIKDYFISLKPKLLMLSLPYTIKDTQPFFWNKFKVVPNYTYRLNLNKTPEELFENLTSEKRKSIKKAEKDGLNIERTEDYKMVKAMVEKTFDRKEKVVSKKYLDKILFEFANEGNSFAFVATQNGKASAAVFCIYNNKTVFYLFGGYDSQNKHHGAGVSCMWQSILHARKLGIEIFDFEGSMLIEVEKYFREFGGELIPYYTINKANLPIEMLLKLKLRNRF